MGLAAKTKDEVSFGPFTLVASERLLTKHGNRVELGARALDILICLLAHPNETVNKKDLLAQVWPDVTVEESSLRFHMAGLRKALGDGKDGARYITTLAGRGYCFVSAISRPSARSEGPEVSFAHANLPARPIAMVGRDHDVLELSSRLNALRLVTIVGAGGVGKTTVAVAVGHQLMDAFGGAVLFVDLSMLSDADLVATAVASMMGLSVQSNDATPGLIAHLRTKRILLILDTCEHLIEAAAAMASRIFADAPQIHILATSREALQVEGEHVYRLGALMYPPDDADVTAAMARTFPATQLFFERAAASGARLDLSDAEAAVVASICRKLDGVALAIEMAARRVEAYGLAQTAALLEQRLALSWAGSRTAPQRQRTLQATLDWSYGLLSETERVVLRRLAVFVGHFTLDAAMAVVTDATIDQAAVLRAIDSLVAKSMVATRPVGAMMRYRLLDTTRAYALDVRLNDAELADLAARHATYWRRWVEQAGAEWATLFDGTQRAPHFAGLNNVRAALEWCFGANGNIDLGIGLAAAAAPVFLTMSLLPECHRWSERALLALDEANRGGSEEMHLQAALGVSLMFTQGNSEAARAALNRGLAIAEERGGAADQLQLLSLLHMFHHRIGDFKATLHYAQRGAAVAATIEDPAPVALAHSLLGSALHHTGDLGGARVALEAALQGGPGHRNTRAIDPDFEHYNYAGIALARTLWLQGHPAQAVDRVRESVKSAESLRHPVPLSRALVWAVSVFLWTGDLRGADEHTERLIAHAESHALGPYQSVGRGYKGVLAIWAGEAKSGIESLQRCLKVLRAARYELLTTAFNIALVQGHVATGDFTEALRLIDETIRQVETNGDLSNMPELLRVKGSVLLSSTQPMFDEAERCFTQSLDLSRRQGARAWELRTAIDLADLWAGRSRTEAARTLLQPIYAAFAEGFDTADLKAAEGLLASLAPPKPKDRPGRRSERNTAT